MIAHAINEGAVFFFSLHDLQDLGLSPQTLSDSDAAQLLRSNAVWPTGDAFDFWDAHLFCSADGVLLFLRPFPSAHKSATFSSRLSS